ncbi:MAG: hypothetical protein A2Y86_04690 [Candidatus Aminicenantes bacterium RBG_13_62_12]|nr:MAG: hypothetical protein A2Y86_04690 [Candidatus Aminicenantes bacterium RBG_13_62_12]
MRMGADLSPDFVGFRVARGHGNAPEGEHEPIEVGNLEPMDMTFALRGRFHDVPLRLFELPLAQRDVVGMGINIG